MAGEFRSLSDAIVQAFPRKAIRKEPMKTGVKIVQVETPQGPRVFDFVETTRIIPNGSLIVIVLHEGNKTNEIFPPGQWTHCSEKHLAKDRSDMDDLDRELDAV